MRTAIKVPVVMGGGGAAPAVILTRTTTGAETLTLQRLGAVTGKTIHVDWGDGTSNDYTDNPEATRTHAYAGAGAWKVVISPPTSVVNLDLRDTKLSCGAGQIGQMTSLTSLILVTLAGVTIGAGEVGSLTSLTFLYLYNFAGVTVGAGEIGGLTNLTYLLLYNLAGANHNIGLSTLLKLTTAQIQLGLLQAEVDTALSQLYAAFPSRTGVNGTVNLLGGGNAAPTGVSPGSAECPPSTGWNKAYELVNDSCGISLKHWASVTCQT